MIALQARNPQLPDPARATTQMANMMNMASQQRAAQLQGERIRQEMEYARAGETRAAETHTSAQKKAELEYVGLATKQFSEDVAKLKDGDLAGAEAVRANIVNLIPSWNSYIRPASEWTSEYRTQLMSKASEIVAQTNPPAEARVEYAAAGARDAQGNPIPEGTPIQVVTGLRPSATPIQAAGGAATPRATPTAPQPSAMGREPSAASGAEMTFGPDETRPLNAYQQEDLRNLEAELGMRDTPASFTRGGMGGAGAAQMTPDVMSRIVDSAFNTGVMAQVDFDQLLASQPPQNKQALMDTFQRANIRLQADAPSLADSAMGQQQSLAVNPVQRPQAGFADFRGATPQSRTANLGGDMPIMRDTQAQYIPVQRRDPNVSPAPSPVSPAILGAQEAAKTQAAENVRLRMAPQIAAETKKAERAVEKRSEALEAKNETKAAIQSLDKYIEEIDALLRSADRRFIVGRIEGNLHYLGSLGQNERQAELQAMYDRVKNADTLGSLVEAKQATPTGGSPVGNASNLDVQLIAKSANSLTQTGGVAKFDEDLKKLRREAYRTRQRRIEFYGDRYGDLAAEDPKFKLTVRPIADRYISSKDLPKPAAASKTPTSRLSAATRARYGLE
jgi:hypothetical protein